LDILKRIKRKILPDHQEETTKLEAPQLKRLVRAVMTVRPDELGCDECFEELDRFVELRLAGKDAAEAMPLVQDHLDRCLDCREEFEALLVALRALA
jgi:hypothetical protein